MGDSDLLFFCLETVSTLWIFNIFVKDIFFWKWDAFFTNKYYNWARLYADFIWHFCYTCTDCCCANAMWTPRRVMRRFNQVWWTREGILDDVNDSLIYLMEYANWKFNDVFNPLCIRLCVIEGFSLAYFNRIFYVLIWIMIHFLQVWWTHDGSNLTIESPRGGVSIETEINDRHLVSGLVRETHFCR